VLDARESPPADWNLQRRRGYLTFAIDVAKGLRGANRWLEVQCDAAVTEAAALMQPAAKMVP
jgi:hypothetical protein